MSTYTRLTEVFNTSQRIDYTDADKFIFFSDCHRGDSGYSDEFADNQNLFFHALNYYLDQGFTYIELGDGEELWENHDFEDIRKAYDHIYWKMGEFHKRRRLYLIWGNHNRKWKKKKKVEKKLYQYKDFREGGELQLFDGIDVHEGLVLRHTGTRKEIFLTHGHQGDLLSDRLWWFGRFVVSKLWKPLQFLGVHDPTSPAKNVKRKASVEKRISAWAEDNKQMIIVGHTHRPMLPVQGELLYLNCGSCVHPRCITGIEIEGGRIRLIKWLLRPDNDVAMKTPLYITQELIDECDRAL